jgi:hypothetical protein
VQEKSGAEAPHLLRLNQDIVAWSQKQKCGLKYVIHSQGRRSTELFAPSVSASGYVFSPLLRKKCLIAIKGKTLLISRAAFCVG